MDLDLPRIARRILGEPNKAQSTSRELRFGAHGSVAVVVDGEKAGTWFDHENRVGGGARDLIRVKAGIPEGEINAWLARELSVSRQSAPRGPETKRRGRVVGRYDYCDERGRLRYQVERLEPKGFRQRRPDPQSAQGWTYNLDGVARLPYGLPKLLAADPSFTVYIPEGEKDVDRLWQQGGNATCNSGGAGKWDPSFAKYFDGRRVVILPDNDEAGRKHAREVAANLSGVAAEVRILQLPGLPPKGDVSDWLNSGGTLEQLKQLAEAAPIEAWEAAAKGLRLIHFEEMRPRLADGYLIKNLLASSAMALVYGAPGTGKTYLALHLSLRIAAGEECFGRRVRRCGVVYVAAEAGRGIENRVAAFKHEFEFPESMPFAAITTPLDLCTQTQDIEKLIVAIRTLRLGLPIEVIFVDTLSRTMGGGSEDQSADMGAFVGNIDRLRASTGAAVVIVHHSGKDAAKGARGHSLLRAAVDTEIEVSRDGDAGLCVAQVTKQREYPTDGRLYFAIRQVELGIDSDGDAVTACVVDEEDPPSGSGRASKPKPLAPAQQRALQLLRVATEEAGEVHAASNHIPPGVRCVTEELWRRYCYQGAISSGDQNAQRMAFKRAAEALVSLGRVGKWDAWVWLI